MANFASLGAFVQATILNPWTGQISVYEPLVITAGTKPAVAPVVPRLPRGSVVTIDFGFNGTNLTQVGATRNALREGNCTSGLGSSVFGQVSFCNGTQFFQAASWSERFGRLKVPSAGRSRDDDCGAGPGQPGARLASGTAPGRVRGPPDRRVPAACAGAAAHREQRTGWDAGAGSRRRGHHV